MKYIKILAFFAALLCYPASLEAQISRYETPEYSGPSARMDRAFDRYHESERQRRDMVNRNRDVQQIRRNDLNVDNEIARRSIRTQSEMDRRHDEVRRPSVNE